ncbi:MAG TPA: hypothetical protein VGI78_01440 [Acetobacteraceae bacterium]|jgi:hypothetical protein
MTDTPLYERWDPETQRSTEVFEDSDSKLPYIVHSQNTKPIIEANKRLASMFDPHIKRDVTHVARIPRVIYDDLVRKGITRDQKLFNAWLDSWECSAFRVDDRRKL